MSIRKHQQPESKGQSSKAEIADQIRASHARAIDGEREWVAGTLDLIKALATARSMFPANRDFHYWLSGLDLTITKDDRAALIGMGENRMAAYTALMKTKSRSWRLIYQEMLDQIDPKRRVRSAENTDAPATGRITRLYQNGEGVPGTYLSKNARWREHPKPVYRIDTDYRKRASNVDFSTSTVEWLTPGELFEAMQVRGNAAPSTEGAVQFDMDVCSPGAEFVPWIPARVHLTKKENGLVVPWKGFIWCNPPFGLRNGIMQWIKKFIAHANGILLCPDFTSARWYQFLISHADAVLHVCPKIQFLPRGDRGNALGSSLVAIGELGVRALENAERNGRGVCLYRPQWFSVK